MMWIPTGLLREHWQTLTSASTGQPMKWDRRVMVGIPFVLGILAGIKPPPHITVLLDGTAITTALLFGLLVHVFVLGLTASNDQRVSGTWVMQLIDELRINTSYAIAVGILATATLALSAAYQDGGSDWVVKPSGAAGVALLVHMLMTLGMVLKRTNRAYVGMRQLASLP